ncbi:MAG TPA: hypothetical protein VHM25_26660, partial [Polyangiaceae bacterium]|nr:hypothetical protein [Polyangiaceae bacterium]
MKRSNVAWTLARLSGGALLTCVVACGQSASSSNPTPAGTMGFGLQLAPGVTVSGAVYTISGPNGFLSAGNVAVGESPDLLVPVGTLPIATGYALNLTAPASDGQTVCNGSAQFDVSDSEPKSLTVHLDCAVPSGDLTVNATLNICPMIDALGASP